MVFMHLFLQSLFAPKFDGTHCGRALSWLRLDSLVVLKFAQRDQKGDASVMGCFIILQGSVRKSEHLARRRPSS
jgi:hypothetical protein